VEEVKRAGQEIARAGISNNKDIQNLPGSGEIVAVIGQIRDLFGYRNLINLQGFRRIGSGYPYCLPGNREQAQRYQDHHSGKNIPDV